MGEVEQKAARARQASEPLWVFCIVIVLPPKLSI